MSGYVQSVVMLLYAVVWAVLIVLWSIRNGGAWPPPEMWAGLGLGEGALLMIFLGSRGGGGRHNR